VYHHTDINYRLFHAIVGKWRTRREDIVRYHNSIVNVYSDADGVRSDADNIDCNSINRYSTVQDDKLFPISGWFYLSMILLISGGTIMSSVIIGVQKMGQLGVRLSPSIVSILRILSRFELIPIPVHLTNTTIDVSVCLEYAPLLGLNIHSNLHIFNGT
jgi:hypothetical protein